MAETPLCAYALDVGAPAILVLTVLYRHAPHVQVKAYLAGEGPAPFAGCGVEHLCSCLPRMSRSQVYAHVKTLRVAGAIRPDRQRCLDGRERDGFELLTRDTGGEPVQETSSEAGQQRRAESGIPDRPAPAVRETGRPESGKPDAAVRDPGSGSPVSRTVQSGKPDENSSYNYKLNENFNSIGDGEERTEDRETRATAPAARVDRDAKPDNSEPVEIRPAPKARRPQTLVDGEVPGSTPESFARLLLLELGQLYVPTLPNGRADETRRIRTNDRQVLARAERLLAVPLEGLSDDDAKQARRERFGYVLEQCRAFADLCRRDKAKAGFWGPFMLETDAAAGKTMSRWSMLERDVSTAASTAAAIEVQQRAAEAASRPPPAKPEPKETPEEIAEREERAARYKAQVESMFGSVAKSTRLPVTVRPDDERSEETARRQGPRREAQAERDEDRELEIRRRINVALAAAREEARRLHGEDATLTSAQADQIRRRVREDAEGRTR